MESGHIKVDQRGDNMISKSREPRLAKPLWGVNFVTRGPVKRDEA